MLHYRKTYEVTGYAYDADLHCLECTSKRFNGDAQAVDYTAIDSEGNEIHPVFLSDDTGEYPILCADCLNRLDGEDNTDDRDTESSSNEDGEDGE